MDSQELELKSPSKMFSKLIYKLVNQLHILCKRNADRLILYIISGKAGH